jgi:hypothetical protein
VSRGADRLGETRELGIGEDLIEGDILDEEMPQEEEEPDDGYQLEDEEEEQEADDDDEDVSPLGPEDDF